MAENLPTNIKLDANESGSVIFATDVIATIAGLAATEVEGVVSMVGSAPAGGLFNRRAQAAKGFTKGVKVDINEKNEVNVLITINVDYGTPIPEVAGSIQENVKKAIETMSGLTVAAVNVHVQNVSFEKEQKAVAEIEEKQKLLLQKQEAERNAEPKPEAKSEEKAEVKPEIKPEEKPEIDPDDGEFELELEDVSEEEVKAEMEKQQAEAKTEE